MRVFAMGCVLAIVSALLSHTATSATTSDKIADCCDAVNKVIADVGAIRAGATRRELERHFLVDGGLNFPRQTRYVYESCPEIKFTVDFKLSDSDGQGLSSPDDVVTKVSEPFLEGPAKN